MIEPAEHTCIPRGAATCPGCGESLARPAYCERCGADVTPRHACPPHPLPHVCASTPAPGRCLACGEPLPARRFCPTCGEDVTPAHRCSAAPPTEVHRAAPAHVCPALPLERCPDCGELMPALSFCETCGMNVTPAHVCKPADEPHACPPHLVMPHRCAHCGEVMPAPRFCPDCGADVTPEHVCTA